MEDLPHLVFRSATSMPEIPHQYVVRNKANNKHFIALFHTIEEQGVFEMWHGRKFQYWYRGDGWKYWRMDKELAKATIINRALVSTDGDQQHKLPQPKRVRRRA
jgi:hypothetical protein